MDSWVSIDTTPPSVTYRLYRQEIMKANDRHFIDEFSRELDEIEKTSPMKGGYERIEPEIHEFEQGGHRFRILNFHVESRNWWKPGMVEWSLSTMKNANFVRQDDIVFDLGCNTGFLTTWFALQASAGHVHAFERAGRGDHGVPR